MTLPYHLRPGAGFVLLVCVSWMSLSFFAWGLQTPDLDRVWRLSMELEQRDRALSLDELELLQDALCRYPAIAEDLEGVLLVRPRGKPEQGVVVSPHKGVKAQRVKVRARTVDAIFGGHASDVEPFTWSPPPHGECATLIEVVVGDGKKKQRSARVLLRELQ